jgi:WD40 repeat protein
MSFENLDFSQVKIPKAILHGAVFKGCNFSGANLMGVDFARSDLRYCCFKDALIKDLNLGVCPLLEYQETKVQINSLDFNPKDERVMITGGSNRTIGVWLSDLGVLQSELEGHAQSVTCLAFSPDGALVVSGSYGVSIRVWSVAQNYKEIKQLKGHRESITMVRFHPTNPEILASCSADASIILWDMTKYAELKQLRGHQKQINQIIFVDEGRQFISGCVEGFVRLWNVEKREEIKNFKASQMPILGLAWSETL